MNFRDILIPACKIEEHSKYKITIEYVYVYIPKLNETRQVLLAPLIQLTRIGLPAAIHVALSLPKADHSAIAECGFFVFPRLRASSRAPKQKSRPDFVWSAL